MCSLDEKRRPIFLEKIQKKSFRAVEFFEISGGFAVEMSATWSRLLSALLLNHTEQAADMSQFFYNICLEYSAPREFHPPQPPLCWDNLPLKPLRRDIFTILWRHKKCINIVVDAFHGAHVYIGPSPCGIPSDNAQLLLGVVWGIFFNVTNP